MQALTKSFRGGSLSRVYAHDSTRVPEGHFNHTEIQFDFFYTRGIVLRTAIVLRN